MSGGTGAGMLWAASILEINPDCKVSIESVGQGKHKVLIADHFYAHPEEVAHLGLNLYYTHAPTLVGSYPGARAVVTLDTRPLIEKLGELWGEPLVPYFSDYHPVIFGAIINDESQLTIWQRQPHIDPGVTMMVYLNPEGLCAGGTGIYRHNPTGLERLPIVITPELVRLAERHGLSVDTFKSQEGWDGYAEFLNTVLFDSHYAAPENEYINDGNEFWELLHLVEMQPNRMVLFDARMPHSQYLKPDHFRDYYRITQIMYFCGHD